MSDWAAALAGGISAAAADGSQALSAQMAEQAKSDAEERAANLQLDLHQRMAAADEMMKNRAAERFAAITKQKMAEEVPVKPSEIKNPSLTDDSAVVIPQRAVDGGAAAAPAPAGAAAAPAAATPAASSSTSSDDDDDETDTPDTPAAPAATTGKSVTVALHGHQEENLKQALAAAKDPKLTPQQRQDAQDLADGITAQIAKQQQQNADSMTRPRTLKEARQAAFDDTALNDPAANLAGQSLWKQAMANEREDASDEDKKQEKAADRASHEKIAGMQVAQRTQASADRLAAAKARIEALSGGKGAKATALMQNYRFMTTEMGRTPEEAQRLLFQAKDTSELDKVFKLMQHDKYNELTVDDALKKIRSIEAATGSGAAPAPSSGTMNTGGRVRTWDPTTGSFK